MFQIQNNTQYNIQDNLEERYLPIYLNPRRLWKVDKNIHDIFLKAAASEPLTVEPGVNNLLTTTVPYQFLRPQRFFANAKYAIGPHPYLIQRFLNTPRDQLPLESEIVLEVQPAPSEERSCFAANLQFKSIYHHGRMSKNYKVKSLEVLLFDGASLKINLDVETRNHSKFPHFDFIFIPGTAQSHAQFSPLEIVQSGETSSRVLLSFKQQFDLSNLGLTPHRSTFFLVSYARKVYVPIEVDLKQLAALILRSQMKTIFSTIISEGDYKGPNLTWGPTRMLLMGREKSGKTSFCTDLMNLVQQFYKMKKLIDFKLESESQPNPIVHYPSNLVSLFDSASGYSVGIAAMSKLAEFIDKKLGESTIDVYCILLSVKDIRNPDCVSDALLCYQNAINTNKIAILVLTHIDHLNQNLAFDWAESKELDKIMFSLEQYGFSKIVPVSHYREGVHQEQNDFVDQAVAQVMYYARLGKDIPEDPRLFQK